MADQKDKKIRFYELAQRNFDYVPKDYNEFVKQVSGSPDFVKKLHGDMANLEAQGYIKNLPDPDKIRSVFSEVVVAPTPVIPAQNQVADSGNMVSPQTSFPTPEALSKPVIPGQPLPNVGVPQQPVQTPELTPTGLPVLTPEETIQTTGLGEGQFQITDTRVQPQAPQMATQEATVTTPTGQQIQPVAPPEPGVGYMDYLGNAIQRGYNRGEIADYITAMGEAPKGDELIRIAELSKENDKLAVSESMRQFSENPDLESTIKSLPEIALESLSSLYRHGVMRMGAGAGIGAGIGSVFPGVGTAIGAGTGILSGMTVAGLGVEVSSTIMDGLNELKIDTKDPEALKVAFSNPSVMDYLRQKAYARGIPIAVLDAVSMGVAGKLLGKPVASAVGRGLQVLGEAGIQGGFGATGELLAQINSGGDIKGYEVLAEGLAEIPGSIPEVGIAVLSKNKGAGKDTKAESARVAISNPDMPIDAINESIDVGVGTGEISATQATELKQEVAKAREIDAKIPAEIKDTELRVTAIGLIDERDNLNAQLETVDEAFKPAIQEKIKGINEQLQELSQIPQQQGTQAFFETNQPSQTNPLLRLPESVDAVMDKIDQGILVSAESLFDVYNSVQTAIRETLANRAITPEERSATINILSGMLTDIDRANTEGQRFVEQVKEVSVQDRVPAVREGGKPLPQGKAPKGTPTPSISQAKAIREENRRKQAGTTTLPSSGETIITPAPAPETTTAPATTEVATEAVTETPTGTTAEAEVATTETPVAVTADTNPALADVESTAKALEGVDKENLQSIPNIGFHGSKVGVSKKLNFNNDEFGIHFGTYEQADNLAKSRNGITEAYIIDLKNPLKTERDFPRWEWYIVSKLFHKDGVITNEQLEYVTKERNNDALIKVLKDNGYDGIEYNNAFEGTGKSIIPFEKKSIIPISEAYHKAKQDGSNPELVQAVEQLLAPVSQTETHTTSQTETAETVATTTETGGQEAGQVTTTTTTETPPAEPQKPRTAKEAREQAKAKAKAEREAKLKELSTKEEEINKEILKGLGSLSMNLSPQQVSLLAQKAWIKVQKILLQTELSSTAIADAIKRAIDKAISEINDQLVANGQQPLDPDSDDITNIIRGVTMLAFPNQQPGGQIGTSVYTKNQEELAERKFRKFREGKKNPDPKSEPFLRAVRRKIAEIRQKLDSPKALLNMVEAEIGRIPHYSYQKTRELPIGRAMEQLRGKARSLAIPYMERFKEVIDPIKDNIEDFEQYLILKRIIDRNIADKLNQKDPNSTANRRTTGGFTETDADIALNAMRNRLGTEFDKFETAGEELQKIYDDNLKDLVKAGVLSQKRYNDIKAQNKFYVPFDVVQRDFRGNIITDMKTDKTLSSNIIKAIGGIETPKTASELDSTIDAFYKMMESGDIDADSYYYRSTEYITDARDSGIITQEQFESLMDALADPALELGSPLNKTLKIIQSSQYQVARQGYMNDIDNLVNSDKDEIYFHRLKPGEKISPDEAIITYYKDGELQRVSVSKNLKDAIDGATRAELGAFQTAMAYASTPFKLLATGLSPVFMPVNFTIDIARSLTSKAGLGSGKTALEKAIEPIQIPILYTEALMESIVGNLINTELGKAMGLKKITPEFMYNEYKEWSKSPSYSEGTYFGTMFEEAFKVDSKQDIKDQEFVEKWTKRINTILSNPSLSKSIADGLMQEKKLNRDAFQGMLDILKITGKILENTHKVYGNIKLSGTELGARRGLDKYMGGYIDKLKQNKSVSTPQQIQDSYDAVQDEILNNIGSPNFEQIPPNIRNASLWLPFLGAAIKGNMTDLTRATMQTGTKNAKSDAIAFALRNGALFAVPAFASALYIGLKDDDDEEKKLYDQIDEATKNRNQIYMVTRKDSTGRSYSDAIMIPIRGLPEVFNAVGRASGQALAETMKEELTPKELGKITEDMVIASLSSQMVGNLADKTFLTDVNPETGERNEIRKEPELTNRLMSMVSGTNPMVKFISEELANKNFFTKHDLTPENRRANALKLAILNQEIDKKTGKPISPSLLRTRFTSEWAIEASKELEKMGIRATPILLDHISDAFLAGSPKTWEMGPINKIKGRFSWMEKQQAYENMNKRRESYEKKEAEEYKKQKNIPK